MRAMIFWLVMAVTLPVGADRIVVLEEDFQTEDGWEEDIEGDYSILPDGLVWYALDEAILPTPAFIMEVWDGGTGGSSVQYTISLPVIPDFFEDASGMAGLGWLIDMTVWVSKAPYDLRPIICNNAEPWDGTSLTVTVPEGHQEEAISYRVLLPPTDTLSSDTVLFIFHLGGQGEVVLGFDDFVVTALEAISLITMEEGSPRRSVRTTTGAITFTDETAFRGVEAAVHEITEPGSTLTDCEVTVRFRLPALPEKNLRISLAATADKAPYEFQIGVRDQGTGETRMAGEAGTIDKPNEWQEFSWVVGCPASRNLELVIWDGGQGVANFLLDDVLMEWTAEEAPAPVAEWSIY